MKFSPPSQQPMFKKLALLSAVMLGVAPSTSGAQQSSPSCAESPFVASFFSNATPAACSGFYTGNENKGGTFDGNQLAGLEAVNGGSAVGLTNIEQIVTLSGSNLNFSFGLSGATIIGIHWGGGNNLLQEVFGNGNGYGTVFFRFDNAPAVISLNESWKQGYSNAAVYKTTECVIGQTCPGITSVPEPSTYALMATGLLGIFGFARRRRNNA